MNAALQWILYSGFPTRFSPKSGQPPGSEVTSNTIRLKLAAGTVLTCSVGAEFSLDNGETWLTTATVGGVVYVRTKGLASEFGGITTAITLIATSGETVVNHSMSVTTTDTHNDLIFTVAGYSATWTPPTFTAALLDSGSFLWRRPDGTTFTSKTPAMTNFSQLGEYRCVCPDWSKVTAFSFAPGAASRNWLSHINLDVIFPKMTGLLSCVLRDIPSLVDDVTSWRLPSSMTNIGSFLYGCTGLTGVVTGWILPTGATNIGYFLYGCTGLTGVVTGWGLPAGATNIGSFLYGCTGLTGVVTGWILPTGATNISNFLLGCTGLTGVVTGWVLPAGATDIGYFLYGCTGLTGVVTGWILPTGATNIGSFLYGCTGLTGVVTGWILPTGATDIGYFLYGCTGLTGVFPTPAALSVCTTYQDIIKNNLLITGDVSTWTWRINITNASMSNTRLTYGTGQSLRTNVKNGLVFSLDNCVLSQGAVDMVLIDLDISGAINGTVVVNQSDAAPSEYGMIAALNLLAKGWSATIN